MKITVPRAAMRALMHLALQPAKKSGKNPDRRDYLRGILLEVACDEVRMVATDGNAMGIFRSDTVAPQGIEPGTTKLIGVPIETVKKLKPITAKKDAREWVSFCGNTTLDPTQWLMQDGAEAHFFTPLKAAYPEYRKPVPESVDGHAMQYDLDLLARFADVAREFGGKGAEVRLTHSSQASGKPGLVKLTSKTHYAYDNFLGLIMPLKADADFIRPPAWVKQTYADRELAMFIDINKEAA